MNKNITIFGVGKLGLCFALNLEKAGFNILGVDVSKEYVDSLNSKSINSSEQGVNELLRASKNFKACMDVEEGLAHSDTLFVLVATPSLSNGKYDHSQILSVVNSIMKYGKQTTRKDLIIGCTVMPGFCNELQIKLNDYGYNVCYNPEFIAQGTIIRDQLSPDLVLIGSNCQNSFNNIKKIYEAMVINNPNYVLMSPLSAEICKISLNCFVTTKIAFTNMIGDLASKVGAEPQKILDAIGSDSRVGPKCMKYGFGYGGPCFPRDNRALGIYAKENSCSINISDATDLSNQNHLKFMIDSFVGDKITIDGVTYKPESTIIEESQKLYYAVALAKKNIKVTIKDKEEVITKLKSIYGELFTYEN